MIALLLLFLQAAVTPQIDRGQALFLDSSKGCAACHQLKGKGTAVGPDLTNIGRLQPTAIATAARSTVTQYVQRVQLRNGTAFPGMPAAGGPNTQFFDVSKRPPELRNLDKAEISTITGNDLWKHPPAAAKISNDDLAAIIAWIRYAATGSKQPVDPADAQ
jgi:mono/diheme cytochrome c family protein